MAQSYALVHVNTWFAKGDAHLMAYESGGIQSQMDCLMVRRKDKSKVVNCKVILGEACVKQHRMLVMDIKIG